MGRNMSKYLFSEKAKFDDEFRFVFLCGSSYKESNKSDKRNILSDFIESLNNGDKILRPIILEKNFMFGAKSKRYLKYDDINLGNLYQVESLVNYIADKTIIIHETISTGAETGLFLGNKSSWSKTCLLIPDVVAVDEDKQGMFLKLALMNMEPSVKVIRYYPKVERFHVSNNLSVFHNYFVSDKIGTNLSERLRCFLLVPNSKEVFSLTNSKRLAHQRGSIYYAVDGKGGLIVEMLPRTILTAICCLFGIDEYRKSWGQPEWDGIGKIITDIRIKLNDVLLNTVIEKTGETYSNCTIKLQINDKGLSLHNVIGMCLYLMRAAGLIEIKKNGDKVSITRRVIKVVNNHNEYFYSRYEKGIKERVENRIG